MADIAKIGFSANTGDLDQAKVKLNALVPAAKSAEKATDGFNRAAAGITRNSSGAATGIKSFAAAAQGAASGTLGVGKAALAAGSAMGTIQRAAAGAASGLAGMDLATDNTARAIQRMSSAASGTGAVLGAFDSHVTAMKASLASVPAAAAGAQSSLARLGSAANDNINRMQATPGNIAAQFQDIGVTAAGGMQPYLIALQQGTQLSAAMQGGLGNLMGAFAQMLSPVSLLTIATVGLLAAWIQSVNWYKVAKSALNGLADALEATAVYVAALGAVLLLAFSPQIIAGVYRLTVAIGTGLVSAVGSATAAMVAFAVANPFSAIVLAIGAVIAIIYVLSKTFGGEFTKITDTIRKAANFLIGSFVGAYEAVKKTWSMLPAAIGDAAIRTANLVISTVDNMVNKSIESINGLTAKIPGGAALNIGFRANSGQLKNENAGAATAVSAVVTAEMGKAQGKDYVGGFIEGVKDMASDAADAMRKFAKGLAPKTKDKKAGKSAGDKQGDAFQNIIEGAQNDIATENARAAAVGMSVEAAARMTQQQKLLNQANSAGIKLTETMRAKIDELATAYGKAKVEADMAEFSQGIKDVAALDLDKIRMATQDVGKFGRELAYSSKMAELLAQAASQKIQPDAAMIQMFKDIANSFADATAAYEKTDFMDKMRRDSEATTFALQRERGELGLGGAALEAYRIETELLARAKQANLDKDPAVIAAIQATAQAQGQLRAQIDNARYAFNLARSSAGGFIDDLKSGLEQGKSVFASFTSAVTNMLDKVIDKLMDVTLDAAFQGNTKGSMGFINSIAGLFGGGGSSAFGATVRDGANSALTGAIGPSYNPLTRYAKGGVVHGATMFNSASGAGMMGEAGPEAIMPLKRGANGALGVAVNDNGRSSGGGAPVITITNSYTISGSSTADMQATVRAAAEQQRNQLRTEVPAILAEYQQNGAIV